MLPSPFLLGATNERDRATRIGIARIAVGSTVMTGGPARRLFGIPEAQDTPGLRAIARLFAVRNIVLGTWTLLARDQHADERRRCYQLNAAVDATDVVVLLAAGLRDKTFRQAAVMGSLLGTSALLAWLELLQDVG